MNSFELKNHKPYIVMSLAQGTVTRSQRYNLIWIKQKLLAESLGDRAPHFLRRAAAGEQVIMGLLRLDHRSLPNSEKLA